MTYCLSTLESVFGGYLWVEMGANSQKQVDPSEPAARLGRRWPKIAFFDLMNQTPPDNGH